MPEQAGDSVTKNMHALAVLGNGHKVCTPHMHTSALHQLPAAGFEGGGGCAAAMNVSMLGLTHRLWTEPTRHRPCLLCRSFSSSSCCYCSFCSFMLRRHKFESGNGGGVRTIYALKLGSQHTAVCNGFRFQRICSRNAMQQKEQSESPIEVEFFRNSPISYPFKAGIHRYIANYSEFRVSQLAWHLLER